MILKLTINTFSWTTLVRPNACSDISIPSAATRYLLTLPHLLHSEARNKIKTNLTGYILKHYSHEIVFAGKVATPPAGTLEPVLCMLGVGSKACPQCYRHVAGGGLWWTGRAFETIHQSCTLTTHWFTLIIIPLWSPSPSKCTPPSRFLKI